MCVTARHGHYYKPKAMPAAQPGQRQRRWRPGTQALREIRHYQRSTELCIPKRPFMWYVV